MENGRLFETLKNRQKVNVEVSLLKFSCEYKADLKEALQKMGMVQAFDGGAADFDCSGELIDGRLHIENMMQMTTLTVDEKGTRAVSKIEMEAGSFRFYSNLFLPFYSLFLLMAYRFVWKVILQIKPQQPCPL